MANRIMIVIGFPSVISLLIVLLYMTNALTTTAAADKLDVLREVEEKVRTAETLIYANTVALESATQRLAGIDNTLLRIESKMEVAYGLSPRGEN